MDSTTCISWNDYLYRHAFTTHQKERKALVLAGSEGPLRPEQQMEGIEIGT